MLTLPVSPELKLTDQGLVDVTRGVIVPLIGPVGRTPGGRSPARPPDIVGRRSGMIKRTPELDAFELRRLRRPADYRRNLALLEEMWQFAREMGAFSSPRTSDDLEADIRYARAINVLRAPGTNRLNP